MVPQVQYQWMSMPFGLKIAPSNCQQQWVDKIFAPIVAFCLAYLDNILIFSSNMAQHIKHLKEFLKLLQQTGLVLSTTKCVFGVAEVEFLGILICKGRIKLQSHVLEKIASFPPKLNELKEIQSFLGCLNWANWQIPYLSEYAKDLRALLLKSTDGVWHPHHTAALLKLQTLCRNLPPLKLPGDGLLILYSDASLLGGGGILCEQDKDSKLHICRFASGSFNKAQQNYPSAHREILAAKKVMNKFKLFIIGKPIILRSDLKNFHGFLTSKNSEDIGNGRLIRWATWFAYWDVTYEHVPGLKNNIADFLSRYFES